MTALAWHAVQTNARAESLVNKLLLQQGFETLYLHYRDTVKHARRQIAVLKAYFPRYLFVGVPRDRGIHAINHTAGVAATICNGDVPLAVPAPVIDELRGRGDSEGCVTMTPKQRERWQAGQRVRIDEGPFLGFVGVVGVDNGKEVTVWVNLFRSQIQSAFNPEALSPDRRSL